jgi:hypothetical protein
MLFHDGMTPKAVKAAQVLVTETTSGSIFRPPPGPSRESARKALRD